MSEIVCYIISFLAAIILVYLINRFNKPQSQPQSKSQPQDPEDSELLTRELTEIENPQDFEEVQDINIEPFQELPSERNMYVGRYLKPK